MTKKLVFGKKMALEKWPLFEKNWSLFLKK